MKNSIIFFGKTFQTSLLFIILLELFSFYGYLVPIFGQTAFIVLILLFLIICLERLDWGVYILLAELFIGSKGYLFYFDFNGAWISIRIAFWLIIMGVWFLKGLEYWIKKRKKEFNNVNILKSVFVSARRVCVYLCSIATSKLAHRRTLAKAQINTDFYFRFFKSKLLYYFIAWFAIIGWGLLMGFINGNSFNNIFDDFNAYLFFGLIFVFYDVITSWNHVKQIMQILAAGLIVMSSKTIGLLYFFSHKFFGVTALYKWVRTSGVGEITNMGGDYYRIFFQSHVYVIIGFVMVLIFWLFSKFEWWRCLKISNIKYQISNKFKIQNSKFKTSNNQQLTTNNQYDYFWQHCALLVLSTSIILISLSRSFWVGLIGGLVILFTFYLINENFNYKKFILNFIIISVFILYIFFIYYTKYYFGLIIAAILFFYFLIKILKLSKKRIYTFISLIIIIFLLGFGLINDVVKFPWPRSSVTAEFAELVSNRVVAVSGEVAVGSRWNLLKPLSKKIFKFPAVLIGSGFGATVTYKSSDPRILAKDPTGTYTTYAFEWGYLDIWLKLGIIGLVVYSGLLWKTFILGWKQIKNKNFKIIDDESRLILGLLLGLIIIIIIHGFTPYLNHPLGIGYLLLCAVIFEILNKKSEAEGCQN